MKLTIKNFLPIMFLALFASSVNSKPDDFELIKERIVAELLKSPVDDSRVNTIINTMNED